MSELIVKAAIKQDGKVYTVPQPGRHHDVMRKIVTERPGVQFVDGEQGFVTDKRRFVDRVKAAEIALAADQILPFQAGGIHARRNCIDQLYSEDVW